LSFTRITQSAAQEYICRTTFAWKILDYMRAYYQVVRTAARSLRRNAMRSALTSLGIVIGISAVVAMVEIGRGGAEAIDRSIA
jgi:hypothetical protein